MEFKLSKYIIVSDIFQEGDDDKKISRVLFSCRKKMGIKVHAGLIEILNKGLFDKLPDNIFSMLMHYEIIIPKEENEELFLLNLKRLLINENEGSNSVENMEQNNLSDFLHKENSKLLRLINDGTSYDFLEDDNKMSLIYIQSDYIDSISIDEASILPNYDFYKEKIQTNIGLPSFLLPIDKYREQGKVTKEDLHLIIENFKLMLLLKYKINAKYA